MCFVANKRAYKSNKNIVYSCKYHVIWTPKYRRKVLVRGVDVRLKEIVYEVADELQCEIMELEVMSDHVHMLCEVDPQLGIHRFVTCNLGRNPILPRRGVHPKPNRDSPHTLRLASCFGITVRSR